MKTKLIDPNIVGLKELRLNIEKYIKLIQEGRSFIVVRKSTPIFKLEPMDPWGDEGTWETVANFTPLQAEGGVHIDDLINRLKASR